MDVVIVNAGLVIYSLYDSDGEKEDTMLEEYVNQTLGLDLWSNIHHIKEMVYLIIRKAFQSNLPRIHGIGNVDFLLSNLEKFQGCYSGSLASVMNQLQIIQKELESTQPLLENVVEQQHNKHNKFQHWAMLLIGKAYEVEYVVDACIRKELPSALMMNEEIVGFEDVTEELRDKLIKGCRELDFISIVGMPGLGKTTLAKKLYYDESIVEHFDICAQCCVSQVYCTYLKGIPSCFGDICTQKYIEVENYNEIVARSAIDIQEKQVEDYSNTDFKLFIKEL